MLRIRRYSLELPLVGQENYRLRKYYNRIPKAIPRIGETIILHPFLNSKVVEVQHYSLPYNNVHLVLEAVPTSYEEFLVEDGWRYFDTPGR